MKKIYSLIPRILLSLVFLLFLAFLKPNNALSVPAEDPSQGCPSSCGVSVPCDDGRCIRCDSCRSRTIPTEVPEIPDDITGKIYNPVLPLNLSTLQGTAFLSKLLRTGISLMFVFGSIIFLFILTSGGIKWLSSSGDKVKLESAQKQITSGLTGLAILLTTFVIIQLVQTIFGIDLLNITLPTL